MSDLPFGFSGNDPDRDGGDDGKDKPADSGGSAGSNPFGFNIDPSSFDPSQFGALGAGFDPSQLNPEMIGQLFSQLGTMFSAMGSGSTGAGAGAPVNYELAKQLARQEIGDFTPVLDKETSAVADAVHLAETWLDGATALPAGTSKTSAWTPNDWIDNTLDTWKRLCDPVAQQISTVWASALPEEAKGMAGPLLSISASRGSTSRPSIELHTSWTI